MPSNMFQTLENTDKDLFLYLNGMHNEFLDTVMPYLSSFWVWIPLFIWWLFAVYKRYRQKTVVIAVMAAVLILASDQGSGLVKKTTRRYRPSHNIELNEKVHCVDNYRGGQFGFVSSHAANSFAIAFFVFLLMRPASKLLVFSLFGWACITSYSRIYLGVHYPLDIIGGAMLGIILAFLFYKLFERYLA